MGSSNRSTAKRWAEAPAVVVDLAAGAPGGCLHRHHLDVCAPTDIDAQLLALHVSSWDPSYLLLPKQMALRTVGRGHAASSSYEIDAVIRKPVHVTPSIWSLSSVGRSQVMYTAPVNLVVHAAASCPLQVVGKKIQ